MSTAASVTDSGWLNLLTLTCNTLTDNGFEFNGDATTTKLLILNHMMDYYRMYRVWRSSWVLTRMGCDCSLAKKLRGYTSEQAFDATFRRQIQPTLEDCLGALNRIQSFNDAHDYMITMSRKCEPAHIRLPTSKPGELDLKEPTFEPVFNREPLLTEVLFTCLKDVTQCVNYYASDHDYDLIIQSVVHRLALYEKMYAIFTWNDWPEFLKKDLHRKPISEKLVYKHFSDLLCLEYQSSKCNSALSTLLNFN